MAVTPAMAGCVDRSGKKRGSTPPLRRSRWARNSSTRVGTRPVCPVSSAHGPVPGLTRQSIRLRAAPVPGECRYGGDGSGDLRFGVVVVRGEADEWVDAALFGVERVVFGHGGADVDAGPAECGCDVIRAAARDLRGDDGAAVRAEVVGGDARELAEILPQPPAERAGAV